MWLPNLRFSEKSRPARCISRQVLKLGQLIDEPWIILPFELMKASRRGLLEAAYYCASALNLHCHELVSGRSGWIDSLASLLFANCLQSTITSSLPAASALRPTTPESAFARRSHPR